MDIRTKYRDQRDAFNPLTHVQLKHIAVVLVTHQNLHAIFSSFVPHEIPEAVFWCKYFHYLYHACKRYREYKTFLKTREKKPNDTLSHILHLWKTLHHHAKPLETHTPHDALLINTGAKNALASLKLLPKVVRIVYPHVSKSSSMYKRISFILTTRAAISPRDVTNYNDNILSPEHLSDDNDDDADLEPWDLDAPRRSLDERARTTPGTKRPTFANHLVEVIREKPRMSASELQRKSITIVGDDSEVPAHRFLVCVFNILFGSLRHHRLQFIGPLLGFLLKYYEPLEAYTITQAFVSACCHYAIFPFTTVQFDYFFIAFDQLVRELFPDYVESLTHSLTDIYEPLFLNLLVPILIFIEEDYALDILSKILSRGYPFVLKYVMSLIEKTPSPPQTAEEYHVFIEVINQHHSEIMKEVEDFKLPDFANYHYQFIIKESVHSTSTPFELEEKNMKMIEERLTNTKLPTNIITTTLAMEFMKMLPERYSVLDFTCLFSTKTDGFSLSTLYSLCSARYPLMIFIHNDNELFGCYLSDPIIIHRHYYGTGENFLFSLLPNCSKYEATNVNPFYVLTDVDKLILGGGSGDPGLMLNRQLDGTSYSCATYNNAPLSKCPNFKAKRVEVWSVSSDAIINNIKGSSANSLHSLR